MNIFSNSSDKKRRKIEDENLTSLIKAPKLKREAFHLNLSSKITKEDAVLFNYTISDFNPPKSENGVMSLPEKWRVGVSKFIINNEIITFKKLQDKSVGLVYIALYIDGQETPIALPTKYFQHKLYTRSEGVEFANSSLKNIWLDVCNPNEKGINEVGSFFISNIFSFFENVFIDDYIYIKYIGNESNLDKKNWEIFQKLFQNYYKSENKKEITQLEIYISNELSDFFGNLDPPSIIDSSGGDSHIIYQGIKITKRIGIIPLPQKSPTTSVRALYLQPKILPLSINLLTNILNGENSTIVPLNEQVFTKFQLLSNFSLPINFYLGKTPCISFSTNDIDFRELPINSRIEKISIALTDAFNEKLLSLNVGHTFLTLEFIPT